jgi:hypothetical protein
MKILAVIISVNPPRKLIESLKNQTLKPTKIIIANYRVPTKYSVGQRSAYAFNRAVQNVNLEKYDYLIKLDDDVLLPPNFIEANIGLADYVGEGRAMVLKIKTFLQIMDGKLKVMQSEDTYLAHSFYWAGAKIRNWNVIPINTISHLDSLTSHRKKYWIDAGRAQYQFGLPIARYPVYFYNRAKKLGFRIALITFVGYMIGFIMRDEKAWYAYLRFAMDNRLKFVGNRS